MRFNTVGLPAGVYLYRLGGGDYVETGPVVVGYVFTYILPNRTESTMYLVREVLKCKPGRAKDLVAMFKESFNHMEGSGFFNARVMTDAATTYWTVVAEFEVNRPGDVWDGHEKLGQRTGFSEAMKDYMDCVQEGHREIFKIE